MPETLYNNNCLNILSSFKDKSIDLILTDPPYAIGENYASYNDTEDELKKLIAKFMPEVLRIGKVVALTPGNKNIFLYPKPDWILSWVVPQGSGMSCWGFVCWHAILVYGKDPYLANCMGSRPDIITGNFKCDGIDDHPCTKPIEIWDKILLRCSVKETDIVLDPFMGSGTTGIVCKKNNRDFIGIELDKDYFELAKQRITGDSEYYKQKWQEKHKQRLLF